MLDFREMLFLGVCKLFVDSLRITSKLDILCRGGVGVDEVNSKINC